MSKGPSSTPSSAPEDVLISDRNSKDGPTAILRLNRPKALNALNEELSLSLINELQRLDEDDSVRCIIITGNGRAFAAGADLKAMLRFSSSQEAVGKDLLGYWDRLRGIRKPLIAAVNGYALGGGCELAMMCDIIVASKDAKFGQPELKIGTIPGMGGTQRLARAVGKSKAMEFILTGRMIEAEEAERAGLISKCVDAGDLEREALKIAEEIVKQPLHMAILAKECVNRSFESSLSDGLLFEKRVFQGTFSSKDRVEGMSSFIEKRPPQFNKQEGQETSGSSKL